jgi:hypothetical protein
MQWAQAGGTRRRFRRAEKLIVGKETVKSQWLQKFILTCALGTSGGARGEDYNALCARVFAFS